MTLTVRLLLVLIYCSGSSGQQDSLFAWNYSNMIDLKRERLQHKIARYCKKANFFIEPSDSIIPIATLAFKDDKPRLDTNMGNNEEYSLSSLIIDQCYFNNLFILTSDHSRHLYMTTITSKGKYVFELIPKSHYFNAFINGNDYFFSIAGFNGLFGINGSRISYLEFLAGGDYIVENIDDYIKEVIRNKKVIPIRSSNIINNKRKLIGK